MDVSLKASATQMNLKIPNAPAINQTKAGHENEIASIFYLNNDDIDQRNQIKQTPA